MYYKKNNAIFISIIKHYLNDLHTSDSDSESCGCGQGGNSTVFDHDLQLVVIRPCLPVKYHSRGHLACRGDGELTRCKEKLKYCEII